MTTCPCSQPAALEQKSRLPLLLHVRSCVLRTPTHAACFTLNLAACFLKSMQSTCILELRMCARLCLSQALDCSRQASKQAVVPHKHWTLLLWHTYLECYRFPRPF